MGATTRRLIFAAGCAGLLALSVCATPKREPYALPPAEPDPFGKASAPEAPSPTAVPARPAASPPPGSS